MPPGFGLFSQAHRELLSDPIEQMDTEEVQLPLTRRKLDKIALDPKKKTDVEKRYFPGTASTTATRIERPSASAFHSYGSSPYGPRNNINTPRGGPQSSPLRGSRTETTTNPKRKATTAENAREAKRLKERAIQATASPNGREVPTTIALSDDESELEEDRSETIPPHFIKTRKPTGNAAIKALSALADQIPDRESRPQSASTKWTSETTSNLRRGKPARRDLVSTKRMPNEVKMELALFQQGCLVVEPALLTFSRDMVDESKKIHIFRPGEDKEVTHFYALDVKSMKYNEESYKVLIESRNFITNPKNGSHVQMIMQEAKDVSTMVKLFNVSKASVERATEDEIDRLCKKFHEYRRTKPTTIEYAARSAAQTITLDIPARVKPKLVDNMAIPRTTGPENSGADRAPARDTKKTERQTAVAVVIEKPRTTRSRKKQASDPLEIDIDQPERTVTRASKKLRMPARWNRPLVYPFEGQRRTNVDYEDLDRLNPTLYLNDNLVNFYVRYLEEQLHEKNPAVAKETHFFNTFFYERLSNKGKEGDINKRIESVMKWTRSIDLFEKNYVILPICESSHWYLVIICNLQHLSRKLVDRDPMDAGGESPDELASPSNNVCTGSETDNQKQGSETVTEGVRHMSLDEAGEVPAIEISIAETADDWPVDGENEHLDQTVEARNKVYRCTEDLYDIPSGSGASPAPNFKGKSRGGYTPETPAIIILDSMPQLRPNAIKNLRDWLCREAQVKRSLDLDRKEIKALYAKVPGQDNWYDCGLYVLHYIERFFLHPQEFISSILMKDGVVDEQNLWQPENIIDMRVRMFELIVDLHTKYEEYEDQKAGEKSDKPAVDDDDDVVAGESHGQTVEPPASESPLDHIPQIPMTPERRPEELPEKDVQGEDESGEVMVVDSPQRAPEKSKDANKTQEVDDSQEAQDAIIVRPEEVLPRKQEVATSADDSQEAQEVIIVRPEEVLPWRDTGAPEGPSSSSSALSEPPSDTASQVERARSNLAELWGTAQDRSAREQSMEL